MAATLYPDVLGALFSHLRASADITALTSDRIGDDIKPSWGMQAAQNARYAVVVSGPLGGPGELGPALLGWRFDLTCYGPNKLSANTLMRTVLGYLVPQDRQQTSFTAAHAIVQSVAVEGGPNALIDPDTRWPYAVASLIVRFTGVPTP